MEQNPNANLPAYRPGEFATSAVQAFVVGSWREGLAPGWDEARGS